MSDNKGIQYDLIGTKLRVKSGKITLGIFSMEALIERINKLRSELNEWEGRKDILEEMLDSDADADWLQNPD